MMNIVGVGGRGKKSTRTRNDYAQTSFDLYTGLNLATRVSVEPKCFSSISVYLLEFIPDLVNNDARLQSFVSSPEKAARAFTGFTSQPGKHWGHMINKAQSSKTYNLENFHASP